MSCFNCGCEGQVAKDCRRKPTFKTSVGKDTRYGSDVSKDNINKPPGKGWIRSGNGERKLSSNQKVVRRIKETVVYNSQSKNAKNIANQEWILYSKDCFE